MAIKSLPLVVVAWAISAECRIKCRKPAALNNPEATKRLRNTCMFAWPLFRDPCASDDQKNDQKKNLRRIRDAKGRGLEQRLEVQLLRGSHLARLARPQVLEEVADGLQVLDDVLRHRSGDGTQALSDVARRGLGQTAAGMGDFVAEGVCGASDFAAEFW